MWPKHVGAVCNENKSTVQLVGGAICVYGIVQNNFTLKNEEQMVISGRSVHDDLGYRRSVHDDLGYRRSAAQKTVYFRRRV